jgi:hypothetical protein
MPGRFGCGRNVREARIVVRVQTLAMQTIRTASAADDTDDARFAALATRDRALGGYRWGLDRKRALLAREGKS